MSDPGSFRLSAPSSEYLSPDPYPPDEEDITQSTTSNRQYDEADIVEEDANHGIGFLPAPTQTGQQPTPAPTAATHTAASSSSSSSSAPLAATRQQPPRSSAQSASHLTAQQSRLAAATAASGRAVGAPTAASKPKPAKPTQPTPPIQDENPFDDPPAAALSSSGVATPSSSSSKILHPARRPSLSDHEPAHPTHRNNAAAASASGPSSSSSGPSLTRSNSLPQKMNQLFDRSMNSLEKHSEKAWKQVRGLEEEVKEKVDDEQLASMNYDDIENIVNEQALNKSSKSSEHVLTLLQLLLTIAIALATATAMFCVSHLVEYFFDQRVEVTLEAIMAGEPYGAYFSFLAISMALAAVSTVLVTYFAPHAKGGGVPYVQAYLNGTNVGAYFSPRIVMVKILALGFTIASGLSLGMEGPFVFIGSGIAIILCKALDLFSFRQRLGGKYARILKNINEERVFMAGGMAAGLAVAFNAPIAGVLMALEGSTAFLTVPVVLRIFGCAMFATFFNDLYHANFSTNIKTHNLIMITTESDEPDYAWAIPEILCFIVIAVVGGLLGAFAIWINVRVTKWRHHSVEPHPPKNVLKTHLAVGEVMMLVFATSTCWFVLPYVFGCRQQHEQCFPTIAVPKHCMQVQCPDKYFSEIGTMIYSSSDTVARILFDRTLLPVNDLKPFPLLIFSSFYLLFTSVAYGSHVPGGLFVPSIVVGGCMGRIIGFVVHTYISSTVNPGVYALLGAASMFGGFTRLALPAVIMLIEMTGDATYLLPIMFCTVLAKVVSDEIVPPLYPQHMAIEGIPTLGDKLNPIIAPLAAKHIMNRNFYSVNQFDTLTHVLDVLDKSRSMLLPVTTRDGKFVGMIMRRSVIYALKYSTKYESESEMQSEVDHTEGPNQSSVSAVEKKMGGWDDTTDYTKSIGKFDDKYATAIINLTPYMDAGALTAHEETSAKRIAAIFRRLGISHLGVSDENNRLVGVITRRHLIKPPTTIVNGNNIPTRASISVKQHLLSASPTSPSSASPDEVTVDLDDLSPNLESVAMSSIASTQRRSVMGRRSHSILMGVEPAVRFDDEEDEAGIDPRGTDDEQSESESADPARHIPSLDDTGDIHASNNGSTLIGADALLYDRSGNNSEVSSGTNSINTTGSGNSARKKANKSSLSRINAYTKEL